MNRPLIALCLLALPCCVHAEASLPFTVEEMRNVFKTGRASTALDIDNDSLLFRHDDGFYTSGLRLTQSFHLRRRDAVHVAGWRIGQQLYTASDIKLAPEQIPRPDRPYAGWIYGGMFMQIADADGSEAALGLDVGCLGPCAGGEGTQKFLHRILSQPQPRGWDSQIKNTLGLVLHAGGRGPRAMLGPNVDVRPGLSVRLGNIFTDMNGEAVVRAGQLQPSAKDHKLFGFLRGALRAVAYDATLQGGMFSERDGHTVKPKRLTHELELGLQWQRRQAGLRLSVVRRSNEIRGLPASFGAQNFLRLAFSWSS